MFTLNRQKHETIKDNLYHLVFGFAPPAPLFPGADKHVINEEEMHGHIDENNPEESTSTSEA